MICINKSFEWCVILKTNMFLHTKVEVYQRNIITYSIHICDFILTAASLSKRAKSSLRVITNSCAVHWDARLVKPSMSANKMLQKHKDKRDRFQYFPFFSSLECPVPSALQSSSMLTVFCLVRLQTDTCHLCERSLLFTCNEL